MDDYVKQALEIVKAQAGVRTMTEEDIVNMVGSLANRLRNLGGEEGVSAGSAENVDMDPKKAIREKSVICMECGKSFKVLTKRHLALHDLSPAEYKQKYGYKKSTALIAKGLARERRKKMQDMRLWEKRKRS